MAFRTKRKEDEQLVKAGETKILDVDASMQGSLTFRDPVNLRINGSFEGSLDTKGNLTVGENAQVQANIIGENIVISGKVFGNVTATTNLCLTASAFLLGSIKTPKLSVQEGATFQGKCEMQAKDTKVAQATVQQALMSVDELAKYLEVDIDSVEDWAKSGRIPAQKEGSTWKFDRGRIDTWIASEKIK